MQFFFLSGRPQLWHYKYMKIRRPWYAETEPPYTRLYDVLRVQNATFPQALPELRFQKFAHRHILRQTLSSSCLQDEIPRSGHGRCHLQRSELDITIQRISRNHAPLVKNKTDGSLSLSVDSKIRLKPEGIYHRDQSTDWIKGSSGNRPVRKDMSSPAWENRVHGCNGVSRPRHAAWIDGFHKARRCHQERRVDGTPSRGNNLAASSIDCLIGKRNVSKPEFGISNSLYLVSSKFNSIWANILNQFQGVKMVKLTLFTKRALPGTPAKALRNRISDRSKKLLVHLRR